MKKPNSKLLPFCRRRQNGKSIFTQEELDNIAQLGDVLRGVHNRLLKEGKIKVKKGKVVWWSYIKK